jgi:hypothetical protein
MNNIIRTTTRAEGGITPEERKKLEAHAQMWIKRIMRTDPIERDKIVPAIESLYEAAGLKKPRVVVVPSPRVAAFATGLASSIWYLRKNDDATRVATYDATDAATSDATYVATSDATDVATRGATYDATYVATYDATYDATYVATRVATSGATDVATDAATSDATDVATRGATSDATYVATRDATDVATRGATYDATYVATRDATSDATDVATRVATSDATDVATRVATYDATDAATSDATDVATDAPINWLKKLAQRLTPNSVDFSLGCVRLSWKMHQGGNMWGQYDSYLTACRDILGLTGLECWDKYSAWEQAAIHGSWRYMHEEFCIVSDFPEILAVDEQNRPHSDTGPSHRWRDGWELYHLCGVKFEKELWEKVTSGKLTAKELAEIEDVDQRKIAMTYLTGDDFVRETNAKLVDEGETIHYQHLGNRRIVKGTKGTAVINRLYKIAAGDLYEEDKYFLKYTNPSTDEEHISFVTNFVEKAGEHADTVMALKHNCKTWKEFKAGKGA